MSRGLNMAIALFCLALAFSILAGVGFLEEANVRGEPNIVSGAEQVESEVGSEQEAEAPGEESADFAVAPVVSIRAFWVLIADTSSVLQWLGAPAALADAVQSLARASFGIFILVVLRGVAFDR